MVGFQLKRGIYINNLFRQSHGLIFFVGSHRKNDDLQYKNLVDD